MADAPRDANRVTVLMGVSSVDGTTPIPVYVDPTTHRMYVDIPGGSGGDMTKAVYDPANIAQQVVGTTATQTITGKSMSGASNTFTNIPNSALTNSAITIAGTSVSLGGTIAQDTITGLSTTGLVKRTATNTLGIAVSGTDYAPATSGSSILKGNGAGGFSIAAAGTDYAAASHTHAASDITSGTLPVANGGTNATTAAAARTSLGVPEYDATLHRVKIPSVAFGDSFIEATDATPGSTIFSATRLATWVIKFATFSGYKFQFDAPTIIASIKGVITAGTDAATITFNKNTSDFHSVTLGGNRTLALSNMEAGDRIVLRLSQDATGSRTVTWFSTIKWAGGSAPTLTTTASKADVFGFLCTSTGNYDGFVIGQNI